MVKLGKLVVQFAEGCAWRAIYLSVGERQLAHLGVDPTASVPSVFGGISPTRNFYKRFRVALPVVRWQHPMSPRRLRVYQLQQRLLHNLDGRFGWGSKKEVA